MNSSINWDARLVQVFHENRLGHTPNGFRIVAQLRPAISKFRQLQFLMKLISRECEGIEELLNQEHPYERLFGNDRADAERAERVIQAVDAAYERMILWYEDFYIHSCVFLDILARVLYWSLPHSLRPGIKASSFDAFCRSIEESTAEQLAPVVASLAALAGVYRNTLKPLRDKVIVHHRPSVLPGVSYAGVRVVVMDEFRPDREKISAQLRTDLEKYIDLSNYPRDDIELVSQLVAQGHPLVA